MTHGSNVSVALSVLLEQRRTQAIQISQLVQVSSDDELHALISWANELLAIRASDQSNAQKAKEALVATFKSKRIKSALKVLARAVKKHGWDQRSSKSRAGLITSGIALSVFGGQWAGIVALGGGVGVPLWVVFGAGAVFAQTMIDDFRAELANRANKTNSTGDNQTIDGIFTVMTS